MNGMLRRVPQPADRRNDSSDQLARIATAIERFVALFESFGKAYLKARFAFGRATDKWGS